MEQTPKEMLKAYVDSQKFNSTTEIMDMMKEMFRDVLQQVMESELDIGSAPAHVPGSPDRLKPA